MALRPVVRLDFLESMRPLLLIQLLQPYEKYCINYDIALSDTDHTTNPDSVPSAFGAEWMPKVYRFINREQPQPLTRILLQIRDLAQDPDIDYFGNSVPCDSMNPPLTPAERALLAYVQNPNAFQRIYLSALPSKPCSFIEFLGPKPEPFNAEDPAKVEALQKEFGVWFRQQHCTHFCDIHALQMPEEVRWGIIHGRRPRSHGFIDNIEDPERRFSTFFPDQHDLIILCLNSGRLLVHTRSVDEAEQYRRRLGHIYWGNVDHFALANIYSLNAFQMQGEDVFSCANIEGIDRIELRQIDLKKPQTNTILISLRGKNIQQDIPEGTIGKCLNEYAVHRVKLACFVDQQSEPQLISIKPPNRISFDLRSDNSAAIKYLVAKGMMSAELGASAVFNGVRR